MLGLSVEKLSDLVSHCADFQTVGSLHSAQGLLTARLQAEPGELVEIRTADGKLALGEAIGFRDGLTQIMPYSDCGRVRPGLPVVGLGRRLTVPVGLGLLGRVIDGLGAPIDGKGPLTCRCQTSVESEAAPAALTRPRISKPLVTGMRVVDSLLTFGQGQRIALLAGSGVGKSTFLGEIAKGSNADVNVVALIGERGREVKPFIEDCLGEEGLKKSIVIVSTSDQQPLMRIRAASSALAIASYFRSAGNDVLFLFDSITRLATSQREVGLSLGEPPTLRGYTPSVFQMMADLLEQMGTSGNGTMSSVVSVLVEGGDMDEPICDSVRSIVDGHIVLDRELAEHGHYPAVNVAKSLSRVFRDITDTKHQVAAAKVRDALATYAEVEDLLRVGAYETGTSFRIDKAIHLKSTIDDFVKQAVDERTSYTETMQRLLAIAEHWSN